MPSKLEVFAVNDRVVNQETGETKTFWTRIGVAFSNRDKSLTLKLDALPVGNTIVVKKALEKEGRNV